jgi:hypothetical protein
MRIPYKSLVGKPEGNRQIRRPRGRWKDNIRMNIRGKKWESVDWVHLAHYKWAVTATCEYGNEPPGSIKGGKFPNYLSDYYFSRTSLLHGVRRESLIKELTNPQRLYTAHTFYFMDP